jgi:hypothetical protein
MFAYLLGRCHRYPVRNIHTKWLRGNIKFNQRCRSGSGIRWFLTLGSGMGKNPDPDPNKNPG